MPDSEIVVASNGVAARPLPVLVNLIKEQLELAHEAGMSYFLKAGELLLEAKAQLPHGEFIRWVERNFHVTIRHARRYMKLAQAKWDARVPFELPESLSAFDEPDRAPDHRPRKVAAEVEDEVNEELEVDEDNWEFAFVNRASVCVQMAEWALSTGRDKANDKNRRYVAMVLAAWGKLNAQWRTE